MHYKFTDGHTVEIKVMHEVAAAFEQLQKDYGGETIRNGIEHTQLLEKFNGISKTL